MKKKLLVKSSENVVWFNLGIPPCIFKKQRGEYMVKKKNFCFLVYTKKSVRGWG